MRIRITDPDHNNVFFARREKNISFLPLYDKK